MSLLLNWFLSHTVRNAIAAERHVRRTLRAQADLITPAGQEAVREACSALRQTARETTDKKKLAAALGHLEATAGKWIKPYPHASLRDNIEVFLVAIAVAMAIRTFFLQPFKIPTGSMQPTLYGITHENLMGQHEVTIPTGWRAFVDSWFKGISYFQVVAESGGQIQDVRPPKRFIFFNLWQRFRIGTQNVTLYFPPDDILERAGLVELHRLPDGAMYFTPTSREFQPGEMVLRLKVISGDHLFVDRLTYNFRRPRRGEIIVFATKGIQGLAPNQYYIKRMVALGGEKVRIGDDNHLVVNGTRLDASTPNFERVYTFDIKNPQRGRYYGHMNRTVGTKAAQILRDPNLTRLSFYFPDAQTEFVVRPKHYLAMGDNTLNSSDSRNWGDLPQENVIGKSFFVYWPFGERFGWEHLANSGK
ncbi:signal peptidase I [Fontisphaera persica]|uniref:signal peptidase I n=1 Tax=Fontisphaera persica TaxID=2974023 RepID=UPI0024BFD486|nr:signal peptidase I [Fontisphaera persica]WCJ60425.1 signal peptidase I [Fontisphaera persica]